MDLLAGMIITIGNGIEFRFSVYENLVREGRSSFGDIKVLEYRAK